MPLGTIEIREGFGPLELSKGFSTVCGGRSRFSERPPFFVYLLNRINPSPSG